MFPHLSQKGLESELWLGRQLVSTVSYGSLLVEIEGRQNTKIILLVILGTAVRVRFRGLFQMEKRSRKVTVKKDNYFKKQREDYLY